MMKNRLRRNALFMFFLVILLLSFPQLTLADRSAGAAGSGFPPAPASSALLEKDIDISFIDGGTFSFPCHYSDALFLQDARRESPKLALLSALSCAAAAQGFSVPEDSGIRHLLEECGFCVEEDFLFSDPKNLHGHSSPADNDHARALLAHKYITDGQTTWLLAAVIVSGYSEGGYEWISNFQVGSGADHEGFTAASKEILELILTHVKKWQKEDGTVDPVKYWITGHSRAAAIANITAEMLSKEDPRHVYAFGFATPRFSRRIRHPYTNIKNYINQADIVPMVTPLAWGFSREALISDKTFAPDPDFRKTFRELTGEEYAGFDVSSARQAITELTQLIPTQYQYTAKRRYWLGKDLYVFSYQDLLQEMMRSALTEDSGDKDAGDETAPGAPTVLEETIVSDKRVSALRSYMERTSSDLASDSHRISAYIAGVIRMYHLS